MIFDLRMRAQPQGHVADVPRVIPKIILDDAGLVAQAEDELFVAVGGVNLHDMPQNGQAPDRHHRLGPELGFLPKAGPKSAAKNDDFHWLSLSEENRGVEVSVPESGRHE